MKPIPNEIRELIVAAKKRGEKEKNIAEWIPMKKLLSAILAVCVLAGLGLLGAVPAAAEPANPYEPPPNLNELSQADQLEYFNLVVNRVRAEKPGFKQRQLLKIDSMQLSGAASAVNGIVNTVVEKLMPGEWEYRDIAAGESNEGLFFSENANASDLRPEDIAGITCKKEGDNWIIELGIKEETNPGKGLASAHSRISPVETREEVVAEIVEAGPIKIKLSNTTLRYDNGYARVTVNPQGQVIVAENGFRVDLFIKNVRISVLTTDVRARQTSQWQYASFDWAPEEPFPPANIFPPLAPLKWWQHLPFRWFFRWFLFGWIWMR